MPEPGQIVAFAYQDPEKGEITITHRVVSLEGDVLVTKGDAMESNDPFRVERERVRGVFLFKIPLLGYAARFIHSDRGRLFMMASGSLVILSLLVGECLRLLRSRKGGEAKSLKTCRKNHSGGEDGQ